MFLTKVKLLSVNCTAVGAMHFAEELHDVAQLALNSFFNARRVAFPASDTADVGRIDPELTSNPRVKPPK